MLVNSGSPLSSLGDPPIMNPIVKAMISPIIAASLDKFELVIRF